VYKRQASMTSKSSATSLISFDLGVRRHAPGVEDLFFNPAVVIHFNLLVTAITNKGLN
jgi:hypothetical protein